MQVTLPSSLLSQGFHRERKARPRCSAEQRLLPARVLGWAASEAGEVPSTEVAIMGLQLPTASKALGPACCTHEMMLPEMLTWAVQWAPNPRDFSLREKGVKDHPLQHVLPLFKAPTCPRVFPSKPKGSGGVCRGDAGALASVHHSFRGALQCFEITGWEQTPAGYVALVEFYFSSL